MFYHPIVLISPPLTGGSLDSLPFVDALILGTNSTVSNQKTKKIIRLEKRKNKKVQKGLAKGLFSTSIGHQNGGRVLPEPEAQRRG